MHSISNLSEIAAKLIKLHSVGWLKQFENQVSQIEPVDDYLVDPFLKVNAACIARVMQRTFAVPLGDATAAVEAQLWPTKQQKSLVILDQLCSEANMPPGVVLHGEGVVSWTL